MCRGECSGTDALRARLLALCWLLVGGAAGIDRGGGGRRTAEETREVFQPCQNTLLLREPNSVVKPTVATDISSNIHPRQRALTAVVTLPWTYIPLLPVPWKGVRAGWDRSGASPGVGTFHQGYLSCDDLRVGRGRGRAERVENLWTNRGM